MDKELTELMGIFDEIASSGIPSQYWFVLGVWYDKNEYDENSLKLLCEYIKLRNPIQLTREQDAEFNYHLMARNMGELDRILGCIVKRTNVSFAEAFKDRSESYEGSSEEQKHLSMHSYSIEEEIKVYPEQHAQNRSISRENDLQSDDRSVNPGQYQYVKQEENKDRYGSEETSKLQEYSKLDRYAMFSQGSKLQEQANFSFLSNPEIPETEVIAKDSRSSQIKVDKLPESEVQQIFRKHVQGESGLYKRPAQDSSYKISYEEPQAYREEIVYECETCLKESPSYEMIQLKACGHYYHKSCLADKAIDTLSKDAFPTICPKRSCHQELATGEILSVLPKEYHEKYNEIGTIELIKSEGYLHLSCPKCSHYFIVSIDRKYPYCAKCDTSICRSCKQQEHYGIPCLNTSTRQIQPKEDSNFPKPNYVTDKCILCSYRSHPGYTCMEYYNYLK